MTDRQAPTEEDYRAILTGEDPGLGGMRNVLRRIPSNPRCKLCAAPFGSAGGAVLRHFGYDRFAGNPSLCNKCIREFQQIGIMGAEIPATLLFADVRGSTAMGERMRPAEFRAYLDRFYRIGTEAIQRHDGILDKLVGDEVIGLFFGGISGPDHAADAIRAAREILERVGAVDATPMGPIPVGIGVHTGEAYVGTSGSHGVPDDFTALGDVVNTTARLASAAVAGELLVSVDAMTAAGLAPLGNEVRTIEVKGREAALDVIIVRPETPLAV